MSFHKKTINDINLQGKVVLLRADYNVPLDEKFHITSNYRITESLPTIKALQEKKCRIVILSHLGRPKGVDSSKSLKPVAKELSKLLNMPVTFVPDCVGEAVTSAVKHMQAGEVVLLENVRFHTDKEKKNDETFAKALVESSLAEVFVQDCFGVAHRAHASVVGPAALLPSAAGLLLEKEVSTIITAIENPKRPLLAIIGGAKIADKIDIFEAFIKKADIIAVGGAMANTFLKAQGVEVGESLVDEAEITEAHDIMEKVRAEAKKRDFIFYLPQDGVVADKIESNVATRIVDWDAHVIASIEAYPSTPKTSSAKVAKHEMILDIGPFSGAFIAGAMQMVDTVVWNGTMGVTEVQALHGRVGPFSHGTEQIVNGLIGVYGHRPYSVVGGGDTAAYVDQRGMNDMFDHVSTGGGASLELMSGKKLPGVECLEDKG
jgi:3-phosphoglycerate kinase